MPGRDEMGEEARHYITNSFAMDKKGGVYVVTALYLCKVEWSSVDKSLKLAWASRYHQKVEATYWGRFGPGSGSSPSLMGKDDAEYVVITDGS